MSIYGGHTRGKDRFRLGVRQDSIMLCPKYLGLELIYLSIQNQCFLISGRYTRVGLRMQDRSLLKRQHPDSSLPFRLPCPGGRRLACAGNSKSPCSSHQPQDRAEPSPEGHTRPPLLHFRGLSPPLAHCPLHRHSSALAGRLLTALSLSLPGKPLLRPGPSADPAPSPLPSARPSVLVLVNHWPSEGVPWGRGLAFETKCFVSTAGDAVLSQAQGWTASRATRPLP